MKTCLKICLFTICALVLCLLVFPTNSRAASESDLTFILNSGSASYYVSDCRESATGELVIPATYNGKPVTSIGNFAFSYCSSLTSITIPDSVTSIGYEAFRNCSRLVSITIGDSVTSIGDYAFEDCSSLTRVDITDIDAWCRIQFGNSDSNPLCYAKNLYLNGDLVTELTIPDSVTSIGNYAFWDCTSLESITIPDSVTSIGSYAFEDCTSLASITIGDSVTSIGYRAFYGCSSLTSITIPDSVTSIGSYAFEDCTSLASITIGDSVTSIGTYAFGYCTSLASITIGDSVTSIGYGAFSDCTSLRSITIPDSVTSIGSYAFSDCTSLESITIGDSVTSIGSYAFYYCSSLTSITIPDSVTRIGYDAFYNCSSLTRVDITDIDAWCRIQYGSSTSNPLYYAKKLYLNGDLLTELTIPDSVTSIGSYAFYYCESLSNIIIPDSVTSIGDRAFYNCTSLASITIPDGVTSIGDCAFYDCRNLESITIGDSVTRIGEGAFSGCTSLESITIPDSVTSIGDGAFHTCSSLESITIPDSVTSIGATAFGYCTSLESITIGDSVTSIGYYAFYDCYNLDNVYYSGSKSQWNSISIGSNNGSLTNANIHYNHIHDYTLLPTTGEAATCTESGYIIYTCSYGETYREVIPALGHKMVLAPAVDATCTSDGRTAGTCCEHCGKVGVAGTVIPATGHSFIDGTCANCGEAVPLVVKDSEGNVVGNFATLTEGLATVTQGQTLSLQADVEDGDVILPAGVNLDLNGCTLTADSVLTYSSGAIIDTSEDVSGLLKITEADGNMISPDNAQLPVYDNEAGGYRFFAMDVQPCAVTGGSKYWFKIKAEKFAPLYELIQADSDVQIKVKMVWDGQTEDTYAAAGLSFTKTWATSYNANEDVYITVSVAEAEEAENFKLIPMITSGGVEITGEEM